MSRRDGGLRYEFVATSTQLAHALTTGVLTATITEVRVSPSATFTCGVLVPVAGLRQRSTRVISVKTGWHLRHADDRPRLVTAYMAGTLGTAMSDCYSGMFFLVEIDNPDGDPLENIIEVPADQLVPRQRWG